MCLPGRIHLSMGRMGEALASFEAGLELAEGQGHWEEEARLRHQMGITLWKEGNLEDAALQLRKASTLLDTLRKQSQWSKDQRRNAFHLQTETLHSLQKVLVCLGRLEEALLAAEWEKCRIPLEVGRGKEHCPATPAALMELVRRQKASVLYFSIIGSTLFTWLITPQKGVVEFVEQSLEVEGGEGTLIEQHLENMRESLGVNVNSSVTSPACADGGSGRENVEEEEGNYLRFFNRSHLLNASSYSLSSLFSLGSVTGSIASEAGSRCGSMRSAGPSWQGPSCLLALYELLVAPMDQFLPPPSQPRELMLVLDGDLHLVPWPVLKGPSCNEFLCERFSLLVLPSLSALRTGHKGKSLVASEEIPSSVVVGNPALPNAVRAEWGWPNLPYAEQEANIVGELLGAKPLVGPAATKENVLRELADAQCIHLATHVSWQLSALVVSPGGIVEPGPIKDKENGEDQETASDLSTSLEVPPPSEFLLTATDILNLKLSAKLVVVSSCHTRDERQGRASTQGVLRLVRSLLAAGAHCVLVSLWPVPDTAVKILLRTFYSSLLQGARLSRALSEAMMTVQHTKHFAHPANWAGFLLFGVDARLSNKVALMGQALCQLLSTPDKCRHALRVTLHLVRFRYREDASSGESG
ncbi:unnamed protein product [Darwinula stevensoni]|uniref:CHAT domain-containing protein n=1 Tax=Darwinula stevensoni TaxID=69355 RepID=A0A7R9A0A9_9CRUS|nr:unnamed protein product [Darwinula stevensoni]CAG0884238.1 unnamed protein product [Darwinula stevensoni]